MAKKVQIGQPREVKAAQDEWVARKPEPEEKTTEPLKRLTVDIPESEHHALRRLALDERTTVVAMLRGMVKERLKQAKEAA